MDARTLPHGPVEILAHALEAGRVTCEAHRRVTPLYTLATRRAAAAPGQGLETDRARRDARREV